MKRPLLLPIVEIRQRNFAPFVRSQAKGKRKLMLRGFLNFRSNAMVDEGKRSSARKKLPAGDGESLTGRSFGGG
jgi:hypothetical protein